MAEETYTSDPAPRGYQGDHANRPEDPAGARSEIERTRARMSETIDEIEDALLRKKERFQSRLDFTAPVRENPIPSAAAALGAGLLLGFLTGGRDEGHELPRDGDDRLREAEERARTWESRARRLMRVAREQEAELEDRFGEDVDWEMDEPEGSGNMGRIRDRLADGVGDVGRIRDRVAGGVSDFMSNFAREMLTGGRG